MWSGLSKVFLELFGHVGPVEQLGEGEVGVAGGDNIVSLDARAVLEDDAGRPVSGDLDAQRTGAEPR